MRTLHSYNVSYYSDNWPRQIRVLASEKCSSILKINPKSIMLESSFCFVLKVDTSSYKCKARLKISLELAMAISCESGTFHLTVRFMTVFASTE